MRKVSLCYTPVATADKSVVIKVMRHLTKLIDASAFTLTKSERLLKSPLHLLRLSIEAIYASRCPAVAILHEVDRIYGNIPKASARRPEDDPKKWADLQKMADVIEK